MDKTKKTLKELKCKLTNQPLKLVLTSNTKQTGIGSHLFPNYEENDLIKINLGFFI